MSARRRAAGRSGSEKEKGAVAVEFALVLPIFLVLVFGIFEFGRAFNIQVSLSEAARESARYAAVHSSDAGFSVGAAQDAGVTAAPSVALTAANVEIAYRDLNGSAASSCASGVNVVSTISFPTGFLTGLEQLIGASKPFTVTGKGVMRCGG
jgi:Flp pilus assembly protein TadG